MVKIILVRYKRYKRLLSLSNYSIYTIIRVSSQVDFRLITNEIYYST